MVGSRKGESMNVSMIRGVWTLIGLTVFICMHIIATLDLWWRRICIRTICRNEWKQQLLLHAWFHRWSAAYWSLLKILFGVELDISGLEQVKASKPFILVSNHLSFLDHLVVACVMRSIGRRNSLWVSKHAMHSWPGMGGWVADSGSAFVKRYRQDPEGDLARIRAMAQVAKKWGLNVGIFPEGKRHQPGREILSGSSSGYKHLSNCHALGFAELMDNLPTRPVLFICIRYPGVQRGKGIGSMAQYLGCHVRVKVWTDRPMDWQTHADFLKGNWRRMDDELAQQLRQTRESTTV